MCVCMCMCVYIYVCMYICIYIYVCVYKYVCIYVYACICVYVCMYIYIYIYNINFTLCLCLVFIVLCISFLILFTSCHTPLPLFRKSYAFLILYMSRHIPSPLFRNCIWSHANIWDGASFCDSLQSLVIDCICRELHPGCLHWFCMRFWLFCFKRGHWFFNAVVEGLIQQ